MFSIQNTQPLERAMDVALYRHELISGNLANLHVSNAVRQDLDFEGALRDAQAPLGSFVTKQGAPELSRESGALAATDMFYVSNARLLALRFAGLRAAMK
jgi:hypothetical protein